MTTCQICARVIKTKNGLIAHHGYQRPHHLPGVQTRSCFGARFAPYELGHDALDRYIGMLLDAIDRAVANLARLIDEPPETLERSRVAGYAPKITTYPRPAGFAAGEHADRGSYNPSSYEGQFSGRCNDLRRKIQALTADLTECRARRAAWVG